MHVQLKVRQVQWQSVADKVEWFENWDAARNVWAELTHARSNTLQTRPSEYFERWNELLMGNERLMDEQYAPSEMLEVSVALLDALKGSQTLKQPINASAMASTSLMTA